MEIEKASILKLNMQRFFITLQYRGTNYHGWQTQPNGGTVQDELEAAFSLILNQPINIVGCGRTDSGVHASHYVAHFDTTANVPDGFVGRVNKVLPKDILVEKLHPVDAAAHARFDANRRTYQYFITQQKDPFRIGTVTKYPFLKKLDLSLMQELGNSLLGQHDFESFCKTHSGNDHFRCRMDKVEWTQLSPTSLRLEISANRFLRGMVRLIVGTSLNVGIGKEKLEDILAAFHQQAPIPRSHSAPADGLFLSKIEYPFSF